MMPSCRIWNCLIMLQKMDNATHFVNLRRYQPHTDVKSHIDMMSMDERNEWTHKSKLGEILSLNDVVIQWHMMEALIQLWDPTEMSFKFRNNELSPSLEEFGRITGMSMLEDSDLVVPIVQDGYGSTLSTFLGVRKADLVENGRPIVEHIGIPYLMSFMSRNPAILSTKQKEKQKNAFDMAVIGSFLFSNEKHRVDLRLCRIIDQIRTGECTMIPLILANMLQSLTDCKTSTSNSSLKLTGPIVVLQIWLFEHFAEVICLRNVTPNPVNDVVYNYSRKQYESKQMTKVEWYGILFNADADKIIWRCTWLPLHGVIRSAPPGKKSIALPGMQGCVAYNPLKVFRQLGYLHNIVNCSLPSHDYKEPGYKGKMVRKLKSEWKKTPRTAEQLGLTPESTKTSNAED